MNQQKDTSDVAKYLFLTHSAVPAGAELSLLRLVTQIGSSARVVFTSNGPLVEVFRSAGIEVDILQSSAVTVGREQKGVTVLARALTGLLKDGWSVGKHVQETQVDVVVARSTKSLVVGWFASRRAKVPLVWSVHDQISEAYFGRLLSLAIRVLGRLVADAYIANSESTLATIWTGQKPAVVIPPGINLRQEHRRHRSDEVGRVKLVAVGRIAPWKGQDIFIRAFARVASTSKLHLEVSIVGAALFGEHAFEGSLRELVNALGIEDRVEFVGHVSDVYPFIDDADILVHSSVIPEPFGSVVIEGMNAGCAVIATKPGGPAEIIDSGFTGLLVDCGDENGLVSALEVLITDSKLRMTLQENALERAKDFDIRKISKDMEIWLDAIVEGAR